MHQIARSTTGQALAIDFDVVTGALCYRELDWFAEPVRIDRIAGRAALKPPASTGHRIRTLRGASRAA